MLANRLCSGTLYHCYFLKLWHHIFVTVYRVIIVSSKILVLLCRTCLWIFKLLGISTEVSGRVTTWIASCLWILSINMARANVRCHYTDGGCQERSLLERKFIPPICQFFSKTMSLDWCLCLYTEGVLVILCENFKNCHNKEVL